MSFLNRPSFHSKTGNEIQAATITLNGANNQEPSFYAPTNAGTSGYVLTSNGGGAPTWQKQSGSGGGTIDGNYWELAKAPSENLGAFGPSELGYAYNLANNGELEDFIAQLRDILNGVISEIGIYAGMAIQARMEGMPEIAETLTNIMQYRIELGANIGWMLGQDLNVKDSTPENIQVAIQQNAGAVQGGYEQARIAKANNYDELHDFLHEYTSLRYGFYLMMQGLYAQYANLTMTIAEEGGI